MPKEHLISIRLDAKRLAALDRMARRWGSRSEALRRLLDAFQRGRRLRELEELYRDYYADPEAVQKNEELAEEFNAIAQWPEEGHDDTPRRG